MGTAEIEPTEYLRAVEFAAKTEVTHTRRMRTAYGSHLRAITNGKLAEIACNKFLTDKGLTPEENTPDFRVFKEKRHRDAGDLSYEETDAVVDVKAAEGYSKWLMVKEADLCMGVLPDVFVFCTPDDDFAPRQGGDYDVAEEGDVSETRRRYFRKFFHEYPDIDFREEAPTYTVHGGAPLERIVAERGDHPPKAIGPVKDVEPGNGEIPPYSEYSSHYTEEEYGGYIHDILKVGGYDTLDNYNRFLHRSELDDGIRSLVLQGNSELESGSLGLFFEEASEDVEGSLDEEGYLSEFKDDFEPKVESTVDEYGLVCELCGTDTAGVEDGCVVVGGVKQRNLSSVKLAGISRAFFGEELCFGCMKEMTDKENPVKLEL